MLLALVLALVVMLGVYIVLPRLAAGLVRSSLDDLGLTESSIAVHSVSPWHLYASDLKVDKAGQLRIAALAASYSPGQAWAGRIRRLELTGVEWTIRYRDGKLDLGPIGQIKTDSGGQSGGGSAGGSPFAEVVLRASRIELDWAGQRLVLPIDGAIQWRPDGAIIVDFTAVAAGVPLTLAGTVGPPPVKSASDQRRIDFRLTSLGQSVPITGTMSAQGTVSLASNWTAGDKQTPRQAAVSIAFERTSKGTTVKADIDAQLPAMHAALWGYDAKLGALSLQGQGGITWPAADGNEAPGWAVDVPQFHLTLAPSDLQLPGATVGGLTLDMPIAIRGDRRRGSITLTQAGHLSFDSAQLQAAGTTVRVGAQQWALTGGTPPGDLMTWHGSTLMAQVTAAAPALHAVGDDLDIAAGAVTLTAQVLRSAAGWTIKPRLALEQPRAKVGAWTTAAQVIQLEGRLESTDQAAGLSAMLTLRGGQAAMEQPAIKLSGIDLQVPIRLGAGMKDGDKNEGSLKVQSVTAPGLNLAGISGAARLVDGRLLADWSTPHGQAPRAYGMADLQLLSATEAKPQAASGKFTATIADYFLKDPQELAKTFTWAKGMDVTGEFAFNFVGTVENGRLSPWLTFGARDADIASTSLDIAIKGVAAQIHFNQLSPLRSEPYQWLTAKSLRYGKLNLKDGLIQFSTASAHAMLIERTRWTVGDGGRFWVHAFWFDPTAEAIRLEVFLEDMSLADWLALMTVKVRAQGRLFGRINVTLYPHRDTQIEFGQGYLYGKPGGGWVEYGDKQVISRLIGPAEQDIGVEVKQKLVDALTNFGYDLLRFDFGPDEKGQIVLSVTISGQGRQPVNPVPIKRLTVNINGFEPFFNAAMGLKRTMGQHQFDISTGDDDDKSVPAP